MIWRTISILGVVFALIMASKLDDPRFASVRDWAAPLLIALSLAAAFGLARRRARIDLATRTGWLIVAGLTGMTICAPYTARTAIIQAAEREPVHMAALGEHLVIGYDDPGEVQELARRGLIGGVFVSHHNIVGKTPAQLRAELDGFQAVRRRAGLPPLLIATDQEGGSVSRLSPLVPHQPPLASLVDATDAEQRATDYGNRQGHALAELGINVNFSPVVDLRPSRPPDPSDHHTRIADRAIAADPVKVTRIALAYSRALASQGITPTLKHFPGLGGVKEDTHLHSAHLTTPTPQLATRDWLPFRYVLDHAPAMLMVSHVTLDAIDPTRPASLSRPVLTGLLRDRWHYDGVLISDDLSMAPAYNRGLCRASMEALDAGEDLLLIAYDWRQYYTVMDCLRQAANADKLPDLSQSHRRLSAQPWRHLDASTDASRDMTSNRAHHMNG